MGPKPLDRASGLFGRDQEVEDVLALLLSYRLVVLVSPSGAGKSSLLQAGLVPRLEALRIPVPVPGGKPTQRPRFQVLPPIRLSAPADGSTPSTGNRYLDGVLCSLPTDLRARLQPPPAPRPSPPDPADGEVPTALDGLSEVPGPPNRVLLFDQFEEVFTLDPDVSQSEEADAQRQAFFERLGQLLKDRRLWAVFSMREEFLAHLEPYRRHLPTLLEHRYRLDLLNPEAAALAISGPAKAERFKVSFDPEAVEALVGDLRAARRETEQGVEEVPGPYVEPVQLQVVCRTLWEQLRPAAGATIAKGDLTTLSADPRGHVDAALGAYYDACVAQAALDGGVPEPQVRAWIEERLITPSGIRNQVLASRAAEDMSGGLPEAGVRALVAQHLLRREDRGGRRWFELAHDRLVEPILLRNRAERQRLLEERLAAERQRLLEERLAAEHRRSPFMILAGVACVVVLLGVLLSNQRRLSQSGSKSAADTTGIQALREDTAALREDSADSSEEFYALKDRFCAQIEHDSSLSQDCIDDSTINTTVGRVIADSSNAVMDPAPPRLAPGDPSAQAPLIEGRNSLSLSEERRALSRAILTVERELSQARLTSAARRTTVRVFGRDVRRDLWARWDGRGITVEDSTDQARPLRLRTNAVAYGSEVHPLILRWFVLTLLREGVPIKGLVRFRREGNRAQVIELYRAPRLEELPPLSPAEVLQLTSSPPRR